MLEFTITTVLVLLVVGVLVWGIKKLPAIDETFKQMAVVVIIVVAAIWLILKLMPLVKSAF